MPPDVFPISRELRVRVVAGRDLVLECALRPGEGLTELARRIAPQADAGGSIRELLADPAAKTADGFYRVPLALAGPEFRLLALRNVFPQDHTEGGVFVHVARRSRLPIYDEGLWQVAVWFTGDGGNFEELQRANGLSGPELGPGQLVRIPPGLLDEALVPRPRTDDVPLVFGKDDKGEFAGYRLKPGEALYTAVVLRFTGRTAPEDVESLSRAIAARSDVREMTDIPAGWLIKIPLDVLEPEFLPRSDTRRQSIEKATAAMERELAARPLPPAKRGLKGVVVILDPGHGGQDPGTMNHAVWEHDYVFDVASRLKRELEDHTGAKVVMTLDDPSRDPVPSRSDALELNRKRMVLTTPPFLADGDGETAVAVNLRWYLANSVFHRLVKSGTDPDKIVFLSLHADARHPSLRGAMVYVPGAPFCAGTMGFTTPTYRQFKEVREQPRVSYSSRDRVRSEAVSRKLASAIVGALKKLDLPVQRYQPIRARVIRGRAVWLPAVLRGNAVPAKVLIEMVNLNNAADAALLGRAADRDRLAKALADALADQLGGGSRRRAGAS